MKYTISTTTLNTTTKCRNGFGCLSKENDNCCNAKDFVNDKVLFVKPTNNSCDYKRQFGYSQVCGCPTRKKLYQLYKI